MGMWCRRAVCWGRVLLGCNKPPIRTHTHDRRSKNPKFNGKTTVDSRELSSQDMGSIRCCESPHSIVCLLQGKSYLLIYTYTYNYCAYFIHKRHNKNTTPLKPPPTYHIGSARQPAGRCESAGCSSPASGEFPRCPVPMATLHSWCLSSCWRRCHHHGQRWWCVLPCPVGGHKVGSNMILNAQSTVKVILGWNDLLHHKWMPCWGSQGS